MTRYGWLPRQINLAETNFQQVEISQLEYSVGKGIGYQDKCGL
jgi:hypothetical protein